MKRLEFSAFDTLFFREARPMESVGARPLEGRFPPNARTLSGVVRTLIGDAMQVNWHEYVRGDWSQHAVREVIGAADGDGLGQLDLRGPFPMQQKERLYPAPLHLMGSQETGYVFLQPGKTPVQCDLGKVYLPELPEGKVGLKSSEELWLTQTDLQKVLSMNPPLSPLPNSALFTPEPRLGIALNSKQRSAEEGMLYQTVHARPKEGITLGLDVAGLPDCIPPDWQGLQRVGAEGRFTAVECRIAPAAALKFDKPKKAKGIVLLLLTPADFNGNWVLPDFAPQKDAHGADVWQGEIEGIRLTLRGAVLGKAVREGGWDLSRHRARPVRSLMPAGSVYFCAVDDGKLEAAVQALQGKKIGFETAFGRGEIAVGYW